MLVAKHIKFGLFFGLIMAVMALFSATEASAESIWERCTKCEACCPGGFGICMARNSEDKHPVCPTWCTDPGPEHCPITVGVIGVDRLWWVYTHRPSPATGQLLDFYLSGVAAGQPPVRLIFNEGDATNIRDALNQAEGGAWAIRKQP